MLFPQGKIPRVGNKKKIEIQVDKFDGGSNVLISQTRLKKNEAYEASNLLLIEDGIWDKRWGTAAYGGVSFSNRPDGFAEYKKTDGTRELIVVADGKVWRVDPSAGTKTEITGATFTQGDRCYFQQIKSVLYISNGVDALARYDGSTLATYSALTTPANASATRGAGLAAGSYNYYYRVSAVNAVGETVACAEFSEDVDQDRDTWVASNNDAIDLNWDDVAGALSYIIYFSDTSGFEVKLTEVTVSSYRDDGTVTPNPYIEPRDDDTTTGPKFGPMCISGNRLWGTKDPDFPYRVYFTGTGVNLGNFSPAYGGGWIDLEKGGRATTTTIVDYQGEVHVLCKTDEGRGQIWKVTLESQTIADTSFIVPIPTKIIASTGTPAVRGVVYVENDILFPNERGIYVLGNEPGVLDVLRTNELSARIRPYWRSLSEDSLDKIAAYYFDAKVFFSVPSATGEPDRIIVYDRERICLIKDWSIGVSQFGEFTDSDGNTHFLGIGPTGLLEFSENYQGDSGVAFTWRYTSPRFPVTQDWRQYGKIKDAAVRLRNAAGSVDFTLQGTGYDESFTNLGTDTIESFGSDTGMGWDQMGSVQMGDTMGIPTSFETESLIRYLIINKLVRDIQWSISGDSLSDRAAISGIQARGFVSKIQGPKRERLSQN